MDSFALSLSESGGTPATPQDLEERLRTVEEKVRRDAREIVEVLRLDFPRFIERVVKDRYVAAREFADGMTDAQLKSLKADVAKAGKKAADDLLPPLEDWGIWLSVPSAAPAPAERRDLQGNPEVQTRVQKIGGYVKELLEKHGFPGVKEEDFRDSYRLPTWFISGRLLVSLVEAYWRNMEEYLGIQEALKSLKDRDLREKRSGRWESV